MNVTIDKVSYELVNEEKANRAIYGMIGPEGSSQGGVGEGASDEAVIVEYDRLGGLIKKGKYKVKTGSFYNFPKKKAHVKPEVVFVFRVDGEVVEIGADEEIPLEVKASETVKEKKAAKAGKKEKKPDLAADEEEE